MRFRLNSLLILSTALLVSGCGSGTEINDGDLDKMAGGKRQETVAVSGKVTISGAPGSGVTISAYPKVGVKPVGETRTAEDGTYCWTTYASCDGLPAGEYRLTFVHAPEEGKGKKQGKDLLEGRYKDPTKSEFSLVVVAGTPQIDVNYDLK